MTLEDATRVTPYRTDRDTDEPLTHAQAYDRYIEYLGGLGAVLPYIPFDKDRIREALAEDEHLNNIPIREWDAAAGFEYHPYDKSYKPRGGLWKLYHSKGITSASASQSVCLLKRAAERWAQEPDTAEGGTS